LRLLRRAQSDLILAIVGISVALVVLAMVIPLLFTYRGASVPQSIKTVFTVVQSYESHQLNASGYLAPNGLLYIDLGRESSINVSDISSIIGTMNISGEMVSLKLSKFLNRTTGRILIVNASEAAEAACSVLNTSCSWSLSSAYIVLRNGFVIPVRILSYKTIEEFKIVSGSITGASARMVTLIPISYTSVNPANLSSLITNGVIDLGELILNTSPPKLLILPEKQAVQFLNPPTSTDPGTGMSSLYFTTQPYNSTCGYVRKYIFKNVDVSYDAPIGTLYVLYGSSSTEYDIMFAWNGYNVGPMTLTINGNSIDLESECPNGFRVVIMDFDASTGTLELEQEYYVIECGFLGCDYVPVGSETIYPKPVFNPAKYLYLYNSFGSEYVVRSTLVLQGTAKIVEVFCRDTNIHQSSYAPYILLGSSAPGQGYGLLFTTQDVDNRPGGTLGLYLDHDVIKDWATIYTYYLYGIISPAYLGQLDDDFSRQPLVMVFRDFNITNTNYVAVAISVAYRFEDDEGLDYAGVTVDKPILFIGLVDLNTSQIVSYTTLTFRELTRYEDTYPPLAEGQSATIFIPLPSPKAVGRHVYEVFIAIQDPYARYYDFSTDKVYNALDFLLYIESVGVVLFR